MSLRPETRRYYGAEHRARRIHLIREAGGQICSRCGIELAARINAAHLNHNPAEPADALLCASCHAMNDAAHRLAMWRRSRSRRTGQLWLMPEIEWAPYPAQEIPGPIFDRLAQLPLFEPLNQISS